jgi:hypothetical protein
MYGRPVLPDSNYGNYLGNTSRDTNVAKLLGLINKCLVSDPTQRPKWENIGGDIGYNLLKIYMEYDPTHKKALKLIESSDINLDY